MQRRGQWVSSERPAGGENLSRRETEPCNSDTYAVVAERRDTEDKAADFSGGKGRTRRKGMEGKVKIPIDMKG